MVRMDSFAIGHLDSLLDNHVSMVHEKVNLLGWNHGNDFLICDRKTDDVRVRYLYSWVIVISACGL